MPTDEQITRICGLLVHGREDGYGWHREVINGVPSIVFGSGTFPEYRRWIPESQVVLALEQYDKKEIGAGI